MTKEEYLKQLENHLYALTDEERKEALGYYSDYLDECENFEETISNLGTPEILAQSIKDKMACVPEKIYKAYENDEEDSSENIDKSGDDYSDFGPMKFNFSRDLVKNLEISLCACEVAIINGDNYSVETRGISNSAFYCDVTGKGTLSINCNIKSMPRQFFGEKGKYKSIKPRILISVPNDVQLDALKIIMGTGSLVAKDVQIKCNTGRIDVGAGKMVLNKIFGEKMVLRCGLGHLELSGAIKGKNQIDCGLGNIQLNLEGREDDYSIDGRVGIGSVSINENKKNGLGDLISGSPKDNHFLIRCGLGRVQIKLN